MERVDAGSSILVPKIGMDQNREIAVFGGGCFWYARAVFKTTQWRDRTSVLPGFAGGTVENPTYRQVCTGRTGRAH